MFIVVCYDGYTQVAILPEQRSPLQLGAHLGDTLGDILDAGQQLSLSLSSASAINERFRKKLTATINT